MAIRSLAILLVLAAIFSTSLAVTAGVDFATEIDNELGSSAMNDPWKSFIAMVVSFPIWGWCTTMAIFGKNYTDCAFQIQAALYG